MKRFSPLLIAGTVGALVAGAALGNDIRLLIGDVFGDDRFVRVSFALSDPLPESDVHGPTGSTPAALAYTIELWRERSNWFDRLVSSRTYGYRLEFDHLRSLYRAVTPDGEILEISDRGELVEILCVQDSIVGARSTDLEPGKDYYFAITARLTPIDLNQLGEVEGWLSGEIRTGARRGGILGVPKAVVGVLADLAGFGDRSIVVRSDVFRANGTGPGIARVQPER
jgi:hypothetical protein